MLLTGRINTRTRGFSFSLARLLPIFNPALTELPGGIQHEALLITPHHDFLLALASCLYIYANKMIPILAPLRVGSGRGGGVDSRGYGPFIPLLFSFLFFSLHIDLRHLEHWFSPWITFSITNLDLGKAFPLGGRAWGFRLG